jgi:hypothetical protein
LKTRSGLARNQNLPFIDGHSDKIRDLPQGPAATVSAFDIFSGPEGTSPLPDKKARPLPGEAAPLSLPISLVSSGGIGIAIKMESRSLQERQMPEGCGTVLKSSGVW